jgi:hydroxypyruvate isomerase
MELREVVAYILARKGCTHPFAISRILVLINWKSEELLRRPLLRFSVKGFKAAFYIEELADLLDKDQCFRKVAERKCVEYKCQPPKIPGDVRSIIDDVLRSVEGLSDKELNARVVNDKRFDELLEKGGW